MKKYVFISDEKKCATMQNLQSAQKQNSKTKKEEERHAKATCNK